MSETRARSDSGNAVASAAAEAGTGDLTIRPLSAGEEELFTAFPASSLAGIQSIGRDFGELLRLDQYRLEWTWVALRQGEVVARAAWWGGPDDARPIALDWFDFGTDVAAGAALLRAAPFREAEYCLVMPPAWRQDPVAKAEGELRIEAAERAGMRSLVERLRYEWTPAAGLPDRPGRLDFRPEPSDPAMLGVLRRIVVGSLDAHMRRITERQGADAAAQDELDFLRWMPSPRGWFRLAYTQAGELVGLAVPGRTHAAPCIGIVGVVPEQRGHGYAYDLLVEATRMHVAEGAESIVAETDVTNAPMAATFARAGYPIVQERVYLTWPQG